MEGILGVEVDSGIVRNFPTGATRDTADNKPEYEGYSSPLVELRFGEYMLKHQHQSDGKKRASDNWQKGMGLQTYADSMHRHFIDFWLHHDGYGDLSRDDLEEVLCAMKFNIQGYLFEILKDKQGQTGGCIR